MDDIPVMFLDFDDVLATARARLATGDDVDPVAVGIIRRICAISGARIVVTSTWRVSPARCRAMMDTHGLSAHLWSPIDGPDDDWRVQAQTDSRSTAVDDWLSHHPQVRRWIIVDDSVQDFTSAQTGRLVQPDARFGPSIADHRRALRLLGANDQAAMADKAQVPRTSIAAIARQALDAIDQGDDDAARRLLSIIADDPAAR